MRLSPATKVGKGSQVMLALVGHGLPTGIVVCAPGT